MLIQPLAPLDTLFLYQFFLDGLPALLDGDYDKNDDGKALVASDQKIGRVWFVDGQKIGPSSWYLLMHETFMIDGELKVVIRVRF